MRSIRDDSTDPETKERLIEDLKAGLGAEGRDAYEDRLDTRLYMQLSLHADELMTMTDEQRKEKIKEIRYRVYANEGFH